MRYESKGIVRVQAGTADASKRTVKIGERKQYGFLQKPVYTTLLQTIEAARQRQFAVNRQARILLNKHKPVQHCAVSVRPV